MEHRLGTGYAQGGILLKLLVLEVFRQYWALAVTGYETISEYTATHKHKRDLRVKTYSYNDYYYYFL